MFTVPEPDPRVGAPEVGRGPIPPQGRAPSRLWVTVPGWGPGHDPVCGLLPMSTRLFGCEGDGCAVLRSLLEEAYSICSCTSCVCGRRGLRASYAGVPYPASTGCQQVPALCVEGEHHCPAFRGLRAPCPAFELAGSLYVVCVSGTQDSVSSPNSLLARVAPSGGRRLRRSVCP